MLNLKVLLTLIQTKKNKKVLLRERKRHTTRRVASTRYAALSNPDLVEGGYPIQSWSGWGVLPTIQTRSEEGGTHPDLIMGYPPPSRPGWGYPPPSRPGQGVTPSRPGRGYPRYPPTNQTWDGVPPDLRWGPP